MNSGSPRISAPILENHGIHKIARHNGKNPLFDSALIRRIIKNPVYCGKIAYGRRKTEKVHGTRNEYKLVEQDDYLVVDGLHEGIVSEELWNQAQVKMIAQAKKYEHVNKAKDTKTHLLSGLVKCPVCGAGMYGNKSIKHRKDGSKYKDFYYYGCKHRTMTRGHKCDYKKQIQEEVLDASVIEIITKLVSNPRFASLMQEKINMKVDTTAIDQEIKVLEKQLKQSYAMKRKTLEEIEQLDPDERHYNRRKADSIESEKVTGDNIYKILIYFDKFYKLMNEDEQRKLMETLIEEVLIYEERQPSGQWLKSITFRLPIIDSDMSMPIGNGLDSDSHIETVVMLSRTSA